MKSSLPLFDTVPSALQIWRLSPPCSFGVGSIWGTGHAPGWPGSHHCWNCERAVAASCAAFDQAVARGEYDRQGYTPKDRKAQQKRQAA